MKSNALLLYGLLGVVFYLLLSQRQALAMAEPANASQNPTHGDAPASAPDTFTSIVNLLSEGAKTIRTFVQSSPKTT